MLENDREIVGEKGKLIKTDLMFMKEKSQKKYEPTNSKRSIILRIDDASFVIDMLGKYSKIFFFITNFVWGVWSYFMFIRISKQLYRMPLNNSLIIFLEIVTVNAETAPETEKEITEIAAGKELDDPGEFGG